MSTSKNIKPFTEIKQLGEFGLIERITQKAKSTRKETILGIGDDAAVINSPQKVTVVTTDMLAEGIHFDLTYVPLKHLGYKAVAVNLSDIYSMNAEPAHITVSLAISSKFSVEHIEELYSGLLKACETYNVDLIGGDTVASPSGLVISITAIGYADENKIVKRSGANENDLVCVSGNLGAAFLGLKLLTREKEVLKDNPTQKPKFADYEYLLERQLKPEPRRDIILKLKQADILPSSMIDISDGLSSELIHICKQSNKGCRIYEEHIPIHQQSKKLSKEFLLEPVIPALNGGEDYELLFTVKQFDYEKINNIPDISVIGHITSNPEKLEIVFSDGTVTPVLAQGWNSFRV